jgi:hypothetical protein
MLSGVWENTNSANGISLEVLFFMFRNDLMISVFIVNIENNLHNLQSPFPSISIAPDSMNGRMTAELKLHVWRCQKS